MPILELPSFKSLERLVTLIRNEKPELLATCRHLVLGPGLSSLLLEEPAEPEAVELASFLRLLRRHALDLLPLGRELVAGSDAAEQAFAELAVDELLRSSTWEHPTQILDRPRPELEALLRACQARRKRARGQRRAEIDEAIFKVDRAVRIESSARKRRQRLHRRPRRLSRRSTKK